ncbi:DNA-binding protein [Kribbella solani]|uniref:DNA-binding protein n=2 Tax=Kribbella solani TaxID=236067 RepID=UPI0029B7EF12|nr:DNA-binding protein [Kribbella solani]MDX3006466.1 DNA-binding protein [Kribbella solani]
MDQTAHNIQQQIELYGEPLGDTVRRVLGPLGLTQGGLAQVIGMSAPMLSQLVSAQRVKIGNPAVVSRLRAATELADLAIASEVSEIDVAFSLDRIRETTGGLTTAGPTSRLGRATGAGVAGAGGALGAAEAAGPAGLDGQLPGAPGQVPGGAGANVAPGMHTAWPAAVGVRADDGAPARAVVRAIQDLLREVASADEIQRAALAVEDESPGLAELLLAYGTGRTADALAHYEQHHG